MGAKAEGKSGNTEKFLAEFSSLNLYRDHAREYIVMGKYRYGESFHTKDTHEAQLHLRYAKTVTTNSQVEAFAQTEFNEFRNLNRRDLLGAGMRWILVANNRTQLAAGSGAFIEHELFDTAPWEDQSWRANFYVSVVHKLSSHANSSLIVYYQPALLQMNDFRLIVDAGTSVSITERLALVVDLSLQQDSRPASGVEQTDTSYLAGLTWSY